MLETYRARMFGSQKVAVTLLDELHEFVERASTVEHRSRSEVTQEALRIYFDEPTYKATDNERVALAVALDTAQADPSSLRNWADVRESLRGRR